MKREIVIVGMGPGPVKYLTEEAREVLFGAREIYFRTSRHPVYTWLRGEGKDCVSFDPLYAVPGVTYDKVYQIISRTLLKAAESGQVVFALPGNPAVFEKTPVWLREDAGKMEIEVRMVAGLSFLELIYQELRLDPEAGVQIINGFNFGYHGDYPFTAKLGLLIGQVGFPTEKDPSAGSNNVPAITRALRKKFPASHPVTLVWSSGLPDYEVRSLTVPLRDLPGVKDFERSLASLYVPPIRPPWEWVNDKGGTKKARKKRRPAGAAKGSPKRK
jgi:tetrapyrrole methylase family protein/MazG family protein